MQDVPREDTRKYGIVATQDGDARANGRTERVTHIVEKPDPAAAPSTLAVVGRYVLEAAIFDHLRSTKMGAGNEIQLTDGIASLMRERGSMRTATTARAMTAAARPACSRPPWRWDASTTG